MDRASGASIRPDDRANIEAPYSYSGRGKGADGKPWLMLDREPQRDLVRMAQWQPLPGSIFQSFPGKARNELCKRFNRWLRGRARAALVGFGVLARRQLPIGYDAQQHAPEFHDLLQEASEAFLRAIQRFHPDRFLEVNPDRKRAWLNAYVRHALAAALHAAVKEWRLGGKTYGTAGDEKSSRADRWLYDNPWVRERGVWRRTTADDIVRATCPSRSPKARARALMSTKQALEGRESYRDGDGSYDTTEPYYSEDEPHAFAGDDGPFGQADDISSETGFEPERLHGVPEDANAGNASVAADKWRRNCDCFSRYWLAPQRLYHDAVSKPFNWFAAIDGRDGVGGELIAMRRAAQIGRQQYAQEFVAKKPAAAPPLFEPPATEALAGCHHRTRKPVRVTILYAYGVSINTARTASDSKDWKPDWPLESPWPLLWLERGGRRHIPWMTRDEAITDATRRMALVAVAVEQGTTHEKPERHDAVRAGGSLHKPDRGDQSDIRPGRRATG
jgi:hypothetical protein